MRARRGAVLVLATALLGACAQTDIRSSPIIPDDAPTETPPPAYYDLADVAAADAHGVPQIFMFEKDGHTLAIFGTMHVAPLGFRWLSPAARRAFAGADLVLTEVGTTSAAQYNPRQSEMNELLPLVTRDDGQDTRDVIAAPGTAARAELETALSLTGISATGAARARPWALCLDLHRAETPEAQRRLNAEARRLRSAAMHAIGPIDQDSPDARIERFRRSQGLAHQQLETFATRARVYASMSDDEAADCVRARARQIVTGGDFSSLPARYSLALAQWRGGDTEGARQSELALTRAVSPAYAARLFQGREREWLALIAQRCEAAGIDCAVAVGFAHLGGADGLLKRIEGLGYRRVRPGS